MAAVGLVAVLSGCPSGLPKKLTLPPDLVARNARPYVVDWSLDDQVNLEAQMLSGAVVLHFDEDEIRVLPHCTARDAGYSWVGVQTRERIIKIRNRAEFATNLPVSALKLSADFDAGAMLQAQIRVVGRRQLAKASLTADDLSGDGCQEATHVVTGVLIGAFHLQSGVWGEGGFEAGVLRLSGGGRHEIDEKNGKVAACERASPRGDDAPDQCAAPVQILLRPIKRGRATPVLAETGSGAEPTEACAAGLKWDGDQCVDPGAASAAGPAAYECDPQNGAECKAQCDRGNLPSCFHLAGDRRDAAAVALLTRVCDEGDFGAACARLGDLHAGRAEWKPARNRRGQACKLGDGDGCAGFATQLLLGLGVEAPAPKAARMVAQRGCLLESARACATWGELQMYGVAAPAATEPALKTLAASCRDGGDTGACLALTVAGDEYGLDGDKDLARALKVYLKMCASSGRPEACVRAGLIVEKRNPEAAAKAQELYERGCGMSVVQWCPSGAQLEAGGAAHDDGEGASRRGCDGGNSRALACYNAGIGAERGFPGGTPDAARAKRFLDQACREGLQKACREPVEGPVRDL